jgi:hypothetical protein
VVSSPTVLLLFPLTLNSSLAVASSPPGSALPRPPQGEEEGESSHHRADGTDGSPGEGMRDFPFLFLVAVPLVMWRAVTESAGVFLFVFMQ